MCLVLICVNTIVEKTYINFMLNDPKSATQIFGLKMTPPLLEVFHLLLLDIAHDHIVNHFLDLAQQAVVSPPPPPPPTPPQKKLDENDDCVHPFTCL